LRAAERAILVGYRFGTGGRQVVHVPVNVAWNEEIEAAVAVVVAETGAVDQFPNWTPADSPISVKVPS